MKGEPDAGGERGVIVSTASVAAFEGQLGQAAYAASSGAASSPHPARGAELAKSGIRVLTIAPGIMETPMLLGMPAEVQNPWARWCPPPRVWASRRNSPRWSGIFAKTAT